jgi:hypothetical protein
MLVLTLSDGVCYALFLCTVLCWLPCGGGLEYFTVAVRVVRGDEKGAQSQILRDFDPRVTRCKAPAALVRINYRTILSLERAPHTKTAHV